MSSIEKAIERLAKSKSEKNKTNRATSSERDVPQESGEEAINRLATSTAPLSKTKHGPSSTDKSSSSRDGSSESSPLKRIKLDYESLSRIGYIVPHAGNKQLSEEYRIIKRPIIMNALGKGAAPIEHGNLVSISSSLPSEGKTFTALNLALSIATELDSTVLLIDGDVLRFSLSKLLGIENEKGLIDLLEDRQCMVGDVIIQTQIP
ncbi:MAG: protein tyrosine kinase, partial [Candidatus Thiodiazotropha sp. (ex Lucinoma borealis)]|nr:protein tyrosine kinase [Candidatus Thiodiazotropha sp. (ex Lucinoma borealis)]